MGEAKTGREAVDMTFQLHPKVVVMDIAIPLLNGLQATRQILRIEPEGQQLTPRRQGPRRIGAPMVVPTIRRACTSLDTVHWAV